MAPTSADRLGHIKLAIAEIRGGLGETGFETLLAQPLLASGLRYQLQVISEASRQLPDDWKQTFGPNIPWRRLEDLGNRLRHAYHDVNMRLLWAIYESDLGPLEAAIDAMIASHGPD